MIAKMNAPPPLPHTHMLTREPNTSLRL